MAGERERLHETEVMWRVYWGKIMEKRKGQAPGDRSSGREKRREAGGAAIYERMQHMCLTI